MAGGRRAASGWPLDHPTSVKIASSLFELSEDALIIASAKGGIVTANSASCALTGKSRDELVGMTLASLLEGDGRAGVDVLLRRPDAEAAQATAVIAGREVLVSSLAVSGRAAGHVLLQLRPIKPSTQHFDDLLACGALREILANLPDALVAIDETGKVLMANEAFLAMVAASSEAEARFVPIDRWLGANEGDAAAIIAELQAGREIAAYPSVIWSEKGKRGQVEVWAIPALTASPRCYGLLIKTMPPRSRRKRTRASPT